ncbi:hypothetical protein RF55_16730 [Lasius niger]|uniref:Uncharacterized protein n=1 Tax=Lasius niger TaxID=67767 RepID=A0A0J7MX52_LASNI|nr:hypothetical protein RF55_16730 [Lasius niger]
MDNALFRDAGCDPITGIISIPYVVLVFAVDYAGCGLKWHNSRIAPDFDGKNHRYLHRLRQMKLEAERNQSALEAKKNLASQTLSANAIADRLYTILMAKEAQKDDTPSLTMKDNKAARQLAENAISEKFTIALEQALRIQSNLKLAQDRALAEMPQDQDVLPALADPGQKEASSYSILELQKAAWAQVTAEDQARRQAEKEKRLQEKLAKFSPEQRAAYDAQQAKKAQKQKDKLAKQQQKQAKAAQKAGQKRAKAEAKRAQLEARHQDQLKVKGELEPVPMHPQAQPTPPVTPAPQTAPIDKKIVAEDAAQKPVAPVVRKAETVRPDDTALKAQVQAQKSLPIPLNKSTES